MPGDFSSLNSFFAVVLKKTTPIPYKGGKKFSSGLRCSFHMLREGLKR